ncbi:hypothetical protein CDAR_55191 [Caerostris darwini]|uniref:Uncharacterized protein n=1 Tax=Caerostris darwini TaxID=1538125 RepID=A0AAV4PB98_9ARAC|nr:hypothetical protein CDAR_55191 [Caerostris darwini]
MQHQQMWWESSQTNDSSCFCLGSLTPRATAKVKGCISAQVGCSFEKGCEIVFAFLTPPSFKLHWGVVQISSVLTKESNLDAESAVTLLELDNFVKVDCLTSIFFADLFTLLSIAQYIPPARLVSSA